MRTPVRTNFKFENISNKFLLYQVESSQPANLGLELFQSIRQSDWSPEDRSRIWHDWQNKFNNYLIKPSSPSIGTTYQAYEYYVMVSLNFIFLLNHWRTPESDTIDTWIKIKSLRKPPLFRFFRLKLIIFVKRHFL